MAFVTFYFCIEWIISILVGETLLGCMAMTIFKYEAHEGLELLLIILIIFGYLEKRKPKMF